MSSVDDENSSTSTSSSSVTMAKPVILRASMLRPSAFSAQSFAASKPATEAAEVPVIEPVGTTDQGAAEVPTQPAAEVETKERPVADEDKPVDDPLSLLTKSNGLAKSNPFSSVQVTPLSSSSGFVFGQNTRDRVTGNVEDETAAGSNGDLSFSASAGPQGSSSGTAEEAGTGAVAVGSEKGDGSSSGRSLSDVAREYEENKNARKRKFEEVETFTGEEDEINVLDVTCKLYTFTQVYEERGRGSLRLNDPKRGTDSASRLVFRTAGSLRVLLNTKIWDGMIAEPASPKSLRITAIDATGQVKVYLVMARPSDIQSLAMALKLRISEEKARVEKEGGVPAAAGEENKKSQMESDTNGNWDEEQEVEEASKVTPDLIADAEKQNDAEAAAEEEELESLIVEVPALKKRALDPDANEEVSAETTTPAATTDGQGSEATE